MLSLARTEQPMRRDRSMVVAAGYWMDESVIVWGSSRFRHRINKIDKYSRLPISTALAAFTAFVPLDHRHVLRLLRRPERSPSLPANLQTLVLGSHWTSG